MKLSYFPAIPKLGFKDDVTSHDVKSGPLHLTVTMENTVIREFTVNVTLYHHNTEPVERERGDDINLSLLDAV